MTNKTGILSVLVSLAIVVLVCVGVTIFASNSQQKKMCGWSLPEGTCKCMYHYGDDFVYTAVGSGLFGGGDAYCISTTTKQKRDFIDSFNQAGAKCKE